MANKKSKQQKSKQQKIKPSSSKKRNASSGKNRKGNLVNSKKVDKMSHDEKVKAYKKALKENDKVASAT